MGATSMLLQITVLRGLLATFSGNELDIAITLSFWLLYVGIGSYVGRKMSSTLAFSLSFLFIGLVSLPTIAVVRSLRDLLSLQPGEAASFFGTVVSTAIVLLPLCIAVGMQFPLAVSYGGSANSARRVYGLESFGAFFGGVLFSLFLASRVSSHDLCLVLSVINIAAAAWVAGKRILLLLCGVPIIVSVVLSPGIFQPSVRGAIVTRVSESKIGEIAVISKENQSSVYANGQLLFSFPDVQTEELIAHLAMTMHPSPRNILVIGGSPGTLREFLKYRIEHVTFVELDRTVIDCSLSLLNMTGESNIVADPRLTVATHDGRRFIRRSERNRYDLIVLNLPQPSTASINRFYTVEFFREARIVLREDGIVSLRVPQASGYMGRSAQIAASSIYASLKSVFRAVEVTAPEYGFVFSSDTPLVINAESLERRFEERNIPVRHFHRYIFHDAFSPFGSTYMKERLTEPTPQINSDFRPSAYLFNILLWTEIHGGTVLRELLKIQFRHIAAITLMIMSILAIVLFKRVKGIISLSLFSTGFFGMAFVMIAILAFQSVHGYVYEMIGVLSASFMIGIWGGSSVMRRPAYSVKTLFVLDATTVLLTAVAVQFLRNEATLYAIVLMAGAVCGAQFSAATAILRRAHTAGRLYAVDLFGSVAGAFVPPLVIIPLFGIPSALSFLAAIKTFSAFMVLTLRPFSPN